MRRILLGILGAFAALVAQPARDAGAQSRLDIVEPGPGRAGALLAELLARPYTLRLPTVAQLDLPADSSFDRSLVVLGSDLTLAGSVSGDVVVIGGDLFLRPGVRVGGRAVAFGGGVYPTEVGEVEGEMIAFRDLTFDMRLGGEVDVVGLVYRSLARDYRDIVTLPGYRGLRLPAYDRVNGLSLSVGPRLHLHDKTITLDPLVTYRSDLGTVDPALAVQMALGSRDTIVARAERGTYTNDGWSRLDVLNSVSSLIIGGDSRNYWRATRAEAFLRRQLSPSTGPLGLSGGVRWEDARSVGPEVGSLSGPWSISGANDEKAMLRPNPPVLRGRLLSALVDGEMTLLRDDMTGRAALRLEAPLSSPDDARWLQATVDARLDIPTFGMQQLSLSGHAVATAGDAAPPQRWSYLGGSSTIATLDRLEQGGDMLVYLDAAYLVPLPKPQVPMLGPPVLALRYAVGGAGVGSLPALVQNVGGGIGFSMVRLDFLVDPASGRTAFSFSVSPFP